MSNQNNNLPTFHGIEHIGLTVPNLQQAINFFVDVLGCEPFYQLGPLVSNDDWMETHLNVHPRAQVRKLRFLRCHTGPNLELFEYTAPDQNTTGPKNSDIGGHHLAFYVDDLEQAMEHMKNKGVEFLGEPTFRNTGPSGGQTWIYFLSPWGMTMELVCYPQGKAYEKDYKNKLWHPAHPEL